MVPTVFSDLRGGVRHHRNCPRRLPDDDRRPVAAQGDQIDEADSAPWRPVRTRPVDVRAVLEWISGILTARRLRPVVRWNRPVGRCSAQRLPLTIGSRSRRCCSRGSSRSRSASTPRSGSTRSATTSSHDRLPRPRDPELPDRAGADVRRLPLLRPERGRTVLSRYADAAWNLGKSSTCWHICGCR